MSLTKLDDVSLIAAHVHNCLEGFHGVCNEFIKADAAIRKKVQPGTIQDALGRFRLWVGNIGAHRRGRASLDYKLREASHIRDRVIELLQNLESVLQEALDIIAGKRVAWEDLSDSESDVSEDDHESPYGEATTELAQLASNMAEINTCLMRLSLAIRNPAPHDQFKESRQIDVTHFEAFDIEHVRGKFPLAAEYLVLRLGKAVSRRRQYLRYREEHRKKLEKGLVVQPLPEELESTVEVVRTITAPSEKIESTVASSIPLAIKASTSTPNIDEVDYYEDTLSQTSYASSSNDSSKLRPPPLPEAGHDGEPFECPLCFRFTSVRQTPAWHKHVYRDLQPYVCMFDQCEIPDRTYESRHEWFQHEMHAHRKWWECIDGCDMTFRSLDEFQRHLATDHPDLASTSRTSDLARNCERQESMDLAASCPLCQIQLSSLTQLRRHLGKHHEELSLFALPSHMKEDDNEDDEDGVDDGSRSSIAGSHHSQPTALVRCQQCGLSFEGDSHEEDLALHWTEAHATLSSSASTPTGSNPLHEKARQLLKEQPFIIGATDHQILDSTLLDNATRISKPDGVNTWSQYKQWLEDQAEIKGMPVDLQHVHVLQAVMFRNLLVTQETDDYFKRLVEFHKKIDGEDMETMKLQVDGRYVTMYRTIQAMISHGGMKDLEKSQNWAELGYHLGWGETLTPEGVQSVRRIHHDYVLPYEANSREAADDTSIDASGVDLRIRFRSDLKLPDLELRNVPLSTTIRKLRGLILNAQPKIEDPERMSLSFGGHTLWHSDTLAVSLEHFIEASIDVDFSLNPPIEVPLPGLVELATEIPGIVIPVPGTLVITHDRWLYLPESNNQCFHVPLQSIIYLTIIAPNRIEIRGPLYELKSGSWSLLQNDEVFLQFHNKGDFDAACVHVKHKMSRNVPGGQTLSGEATAKSTVLPPSTAGESFNIRVITGTLSTRTVPATIRVPDGKLTIEVTPRLTWKLEKTTPDNKPHQVDKAQLFPNNDQIEIHGMMNEDVGDFEDVLFKAFPGETARIWAMIQEFLMSGQAKTPTSTLDSSTALDASNVLSKRVSTEGQSGTFIPSRLISIHPSYPRLVLKENLQGAIRYAALSYVWGHMKRNSLTSENFGAFQTRVPDTVLSNPVRDAIKVARDDLKIRYIWVDSLCIIQDDPDDLSREVATVDSVFEHAAFVIMATSPSLAMVVKSLGLSMSALGSASIPVVPEFDNLNYRKLASEITNLRKGLPKESGALLSFAADLGTLNPALERILETYGPCIWGKDADRSCLQIPVSSKSLFFETPEHREIIKIHLHAWVILDACRLIRGSGSQQRSAAGYDEDDTLDNVESMIYDRLKAHWNITTAVHGGNNLDTMDEGNKTDSFEAPTTTFESHAVDNSEKSSSLDETSSLNEKVFEGPLPYSAQAEDGNDLELMAKADSRRELGEEIGLPSQNLPGINRHYECTQKVHPPYKTDSEKGVDPSDKFHLVNTNPEKDAHNVEALPTLRSDPAFDEGVGSVHSPPGHKVSSITGLPIRGYIRRGGLFGFIPSRVIRASLDISADHVKFTPYSDPEFPIPPKLYFWKWQSINWLERGDVGLAVITTGNTMIVTDERDGVIDRIIEAIEYYRPGIRCQAISKEKMAAGDQAQERVDEQEWPNEIPVGFSRDPVDSISRQINIVESGAAWNFDVHAQHCPTCHGPYEVYSDYKQLCEVGRSLAQKVTQVLFNGPDGNTYSATEEENKLVRVEIPESWVEVRGLLKSIEESIRKRSRPSFIAPPRSLSPGKPSESIQATQDSETEHRPRSGEAVDETRPESGLKSVLSDNDEMADSERGSPTAGPTDIPSGISFIREATLAEQDAIHDRVRPDPDSDPESESSSSMEANDVLERLRQLHVEPDSSDSEQERMHRARKKRRAANVYPKPSHDVDGDSSYSDNDPLDDINPTARRLRRRVRGPRDRWPSLNFQDPGYANTNNILELDQPVEGLVTHTRGPPSIPSDDALNRDDLRSRVADSQPISSKVPDVKQHVSHDDHESNAVPMHKDNPAIIIININLLGETFPASLFVINGWPIFRRQLEVTLLSRYPDIDLSSASLDVRTHDEGPCGTYPLSLAPRDLAVDWEHFLKWLRENEKAVEPYFYANLKGTSVTPSLSAAHAESRAEESDDATMERRLNQQEVGNRAQGQKHGQGEGDDDDHARPTDLDHINIRCTRNSSLFDVSFSLAETSEAFVAAFEQRLRSQAAPLNLKYSSLKFTSEMGDRDATLLLPLYAKRLQPVWVEAVTWLRDNKAAGSANISARLREHDRIVRGARGLPSASRTYMSTTESGTKRRSTVLLGRRNMPAKTLSPRKAQKESESDSEAANPTAGEILEQHDPRNYPMTDPVADKILEQDDTKNYQMRIYRIDSTYLNLSTTLQTTVEEMVKTLRRNTYLQDEREECVIVMRTQDGSRQLESYEQPILIQRRLLEQAGYTDYEQIRNAGREDNSNLYRFTFMPASSLDSLAHHSKGKGRVSTPYENVVHGDASHFTRHQADPTVSEVGIDHVQHFPQGDPPVATSAGVLTSASKTDPSREETIDIDNKATKVPAHRPSEANNYLGFCKGAWSIRNDAMDALALRAIPLGMYVTQEIWECLYCSFSGTPLSAPHPTKKDRTIAVIDPRVHTSSTRIDYKWVFLAKSHVKQKAGDAQGSNYGCLFCTLEGGVPSVYSGVESLMIHITMHHTADMSESTQKQAKCIFGRLARKDETDWDINIPVQIKG